MAAWNAGRCGRRPGRRGRARRSRGRSRRAGTRARRARPARRSTRKISPSFSIRRSGVRHEDLERRDARRPPSPRARLRRPGAGRRCRRGIRSPPRRVPAARAIHASSASRSVPPLRLRGVVHDRRRAAARRGDRARLEVVGRPRGGPSACRGGCGRPPRRAGSDGPPRRSSGRRDPRGDGADRGDALAVHEHVGAALAVGVDDGAVAEEGAHGREDYTEPSDCDFELRTAGRVISGRCMTVEFTLNGRRVRSSRGRTSRCSRRCASGAASGR